MAFFRRGRALIFIVSFVLAVAAVQFAVVPAAKRYGAMIKTLSDRVATIDARVAAIDTRVAAIDNRPLVNEDSAALARKTIVQIGSSVDCIGRRFRGRPDDPDLTGKAVRIAVQRAENGPMLPVSMTKIGPNEYLIANYRTIYLLDLVSGKATPIKLDAKVPVWNPTSAFYSAYYDQVFIANYTGGDVLVTQLIRDRDTPVLHLVERIADSIKGPEGVAVSRGGRIMAVADYVGNAISVFERVDDVWLFRWSKPAPASHGVAVIGDSVYSSGGRIAKFRVETGEEVATAARPTQFATCLNEDEATGELIGSDTITGQVFLMSRDLELKSSFGANGPTFANFSMPHCAYRDRDGIDVLSTYQNRIVRIRRRETTSFEFGAPAWGYIGDARDYRREVSMLHGSTMLDSPSFHLFDKVVRPSYGSLRASDDTTLLMPDRRQLADNQYQTTIASIGDWLAVVANSAPIALLYNRKTEQLATAPLGEWDCWALATEILCPARRHSIGELVAIATAVDPGAGTAADKSPYLGNPNDKTAPLVDFWRSWRAAQAESETGLPN
jgi:hypothetical protein